MKTISLTVTDRPNLLTRFLESLQTNDLSGYKLIIGLEPVCDECKAICEEISFVETEIVYNAEILGINRNPYNLLQHVFERGSELNIYLEDDLLVAPDVTRMAEWYMTLDHDGIMDMQLCQIYSAPAPHDAVTFCKTFIPWGTVFTKRQWEQHFEPHWLEDTYVTWDLNINDHIKRSDARSLVPICSRTRNTGAFGVNSRGEAGIIAMGKLAINEDPNPAYRIIERLSLYLRIAPDPGKLEIVESILRNYTIGSRHSEDCHAARLFKHSNGTEGFLIVQKWNSFASWEDHHATTDTEILTILKQSLAAPVQIMLAAPEDFAEYREI